MANIVNLESIAKNYGISEEAEGITEAESVQKEKEVQTVPIWHKSNLTLAEAAAYSGIGINRLRHLTNEREEMALFIGRKRLIKRRKLDQYLDSVNTI